MNNKNIEAEYGKFSFNCPICGAFSNQKWVCNIDKEPRPYVSIAIPNQNSIPMPVREKDTISIARCDCCHQYSIWYKEEMIYPNSSNTPMPHEDLPEECYDDYAEARDIFNRSPRAAAALLRLVIQKLCAKIGGKGENINNDIATLVSKGLPELIQKSLDSVRIIGNNAVHAGQIDLNDNPEIALKLFKIVNYIVEKKITEPKTINDIYETIPESYKKSIEKRDKK